MTNWTEDHSYADEIVSRHWNFTMNDDSLAVIPERDAFIYMIVGSLTLDFLPDSRIIKGYVIFNYPKSLIEVSAMLPSSGITMMTRTPSFAIRQVKGAVLSEFPYTLSNNNLAEFGEKPPVNDELYNSVVASDSEDDSWDNEETRMANHVFVFNPDAELNVMRRMRESTLHNADDEELEKFCVNALEPAEVHDLTRYVCGEKQMDVDVESTMDDTADDSNEPQPGGNE